MERKNTSDFCITPENIELFGHTNRELFEGAPRGIVVNLHGLGDDVFFDGFDNFDRRCAERNIIRVFPYYSPWSWMDKSGVALVDELVSVLRKTYGDLPVVMMGCSMGGCAAIAYTFLGNAKPVACAANSPVCDLVYHYSERPDVPRSLYGAFGGEGNLKEAVISRSPIHNIDKLPDIPYFVVHGNADTQVNFDAHTAKFVREIGDKRDITFRAVEGMQHCDMPQEIREEYYAFIFAQIDRACSAEA